MASLPLASRARRPSFGALFGLGGLPAETRRGLAIAFSTSVAVVMGVNMVYPLLPPMMAELRLDKSSLALVMTVYTLPAIFLAPVTGALADLWGRRPLLIGGLALMGLGGIAVALAPSLIWVLAARIVQGVGASALSPLTILLLSDLTESEAAREASAQGLKVVLDRVAIAAVPAAAGLLALRSWRLAFGLYALTLPVALLSLAWLAETKPPERRSVRGYVGSLGGIGRRPRLLIAFGAGSLRFFLDYGYFTYLPLFLTLAYHSSPAVVGLLLACFAAGAMLTASQAGRISRGRDPAHLLFVGFVLSGAALIAVPVLRTEALAGVCLFVYGLGNGLISPFQKNVLTRSSPPEIRAGVISLDRLLQQVAKTVSPAAMGAIMLVASTQTVFWILGALSLASVALAAVVVRPWSRQTAFALA
ncbi:MAG TPA: MFS transporter [Chloroflexota bacterium]|nr:MFS transporter [Chloroflexota bacterium]